MIKRIGTILQLLAFTIVMGHNLAPHSHNSTTIELTCEDDHHEESILEFLVEHLFHANSGADQLDSYKSNNQLGLFLNFSAGEIIVHPDRIQNSDSPYQEERILFKDTYFTPLRGPPGLV